MKILIFYLAIALVAAMLVACCENSANRHAIYAAEKIEQLKTIYAPDKRVALFSIIPSYVDNSLILSGETNIYQAKQALLDSLNARAIPFTDSIEVLPSQELAGGVYGIINNSVANIRSAPEHSAELATQALLGTGVNILKRSGEWWLVQTPDGYISWVDHGALVIQDSVQMNKRRALPKLIFTKVAGFSYSGPNGLSRVVSDLVMGNILTLTGQSGAFYIATYPDGRQAFVSKAEAQPVGEWMGGIPPFGPAFGESLTRVALQLHGAPYLWGGTSVKGMDCSGFTKTVYLMHGLVIPRDASQQVRAGTPVPSAQGWDHLLPGDLLFFGTPPAAGKPEKVVHVGMWLGNSQYIHASGRVRISSMNPEHELYDEYNLNRFLSVRRYVPVLEGDITSLRDGQGALDFP